MVQCTFTLSQLEQRLGIRWVWLFFYFENCTVNSALLLFNSWGSTYYMELKSSDTESYLNEKSKRTLIGQWRATSIAGNDLIASMLYSIGPASVKSLVLTVLPFVRLILPRLQMWLNHPLPKCELCMEKTTLYFLSKQDIVSLSCSLSSKVYQLHFNVDTKWIIWSLCHKISWLGSYFW